MSESTPIETSLFDLFECGPGPSSSHTMGPMKAGYDFLRRSAALAGADQVGGAATGSASEDDWRFRVRLFGSLSATGAGHGTDAAVVAGLLGYQPSQCPPGLLKNLAADRHADHAQPLGRHTVPCRRAMHTGRFTLPVSGWVGLSSKDTTIADLCWGRPIDTALIFDCPMYRLPKFGYTRGFDKVWFTHGHEADDYFYEQDELIHLNIKDYIEESSYRAVVERSGAKMPEATLGEIRNYLKQRQYGGDREENRYVARTMRKAVEYLEGVDRNKQFYLWVDSFDPHEPWDPPSVYDPDKKCPYDPDYQGKDEFLPFPGLVAGVYTEEQLHHVRMLYAELVTLCDKYLGELLDAVRRLGLEENTLLLMVSDHGEPMGNGEHGHGLMRKVRAT